MQLWDRQLLPDLLGIPALGVMVAQQGSGADPTVRLHARLCFIGAHYTFVYRGQQGAVGNCGSRM